jgi:type VI secretion system protein ImpC
MQMAERKADGLVKVALEAESETSAAREWAQAPFRILVLAGLTGENRHQPARERAPVRVDRDNLEDVLARFAPRLTVDGSVITFAELDDFHADRLWTRVPVFDALRDLRDRLDNPRTFQAAADQLLGASQIPSTPVRTQPTGGSLLDQIVTEVSGSAPPAAAAPARSADELQEQIRRMVQPHIIPGEDPRKAVLVERVEAAAADLLRALLHDRAFQSLESAWRALDLLTRRIETSARLEIWVLDISRDELMAELTRDDGADNALQRVFDRHGPWSVVVGDYTFGPTDDDLQSLTCMAKIARTAGVCFVAGAGPELTGIPAFDRMRDSDEWSERPSAWEQFRRSRATPFLGLALPRFLARMPYGPDGDTCEEIEFEELTSPPRHEDYLWANAAYLVALLLAESFIEHGAEMHPGTHQNVDGLPLHIFRVDGVAYAQPCAESVMTERMATRIIESGLMPLASLKESDTVRLVRFQSVALPQARLAGRW